MFNQIKKISFTVTIVVLFVPALFVSAQGIPAFEENIQINISPKRPGSEELVRVTIESFLFDIDRASISWSVNGTVLRSGVGRKEFSFTTGGVGEASNLRIDIETLEGLRISKTVQIIPSEVELIWEADSYVPPFYKGKALHSAGGSVKIVAFPNIIRNGSRVNPGSLIYTWRKDNTVLGSKSGFGKNTVEIPGSPLGRPISVGVVVETEDGSVSASKNITIPITEPFVTLYENDPLLGTLFGRALLGRFFLSLDEIVVEAYPYHFSVDSRGAEELDYRWSVGGRSVKDESVRETAVFSHTESTGSASIFVSARNIKRILQSGGGSFTVEFEE